MTECEEIQWEGIEIKRTRQFAKEIMGSEWAKSVLLL